MSRLSTRDSVSESVQEKVEPQSPRKGEISHSFVMDKTEIKFQDARAEITRLNKKLNQVCLIYLNFYLFLKN